MTSQENQIKQLKDKLDDTYRERNIMVAALSRVYPSHFSKHDRKEKSYDDDYKWIVCVHTPLGTATWHIQKCEKKLLFDHLKLKLKCKWDGHSTEIKYNRILNTPIMWRSKKKE